MSAAKKEKNFGARPTYMEEQRDKHTLVKLLNGWPMKCPKCCGPNVYEQLRVTRSPLALRRVWACSCGHEWAQSDANSGARRDNGKQRNQ